MRASATFEVEAFTPVDPLVDTGAETGCTVAVVRMVKRYEGDVMGRSTTVFTYALDDTNIGAYVAMEAFEGSLDGRTGTFNFSHSATTNGDDRSNESFGIVPASGTGELTGITGSGGISVEADGTHRLWFEYQIPD